MAFEVAPNFGLRGFRRALAIAVAACALTTFFLISGFPYDQLAPRLAALLVTAAHQIEYSRGAPEAQVHLAVDASRVIGEGRASGVGNAVLRRFDAERARVLADVDADPAQRHAHPRWLTDSV